jgi:hypothetical protein
MIKRIPDDFAPAATNGFTLQIAQKLATDDIGAPALINCGELVGLLTVIDGQALGRCLSEGLGASRSFGCGLLEVARVN